MNKKKYFLERLELQYKKLNKYHKNTGAGLFKKFLRIIRTPNIYIPYIILSLGLYPKNSKDIVLFWGKILKSPIYDFDIFSLFYFGMLYGESEYKLTKFLIKNLKEDDIFYDIGANYGFYTYLALEFCKEVHSFEPNKLVFNVLKDNCKENVNLFINNEAVSNIEGKVDLYVPKNSGAGSINLEISKNHEIEPQNKMSVFATTLDEYAKTHATPTVIKIDVEGAETLVIKGGNKLFIENSPIVIMEVWGKDYRNDISIKAVEELIKLGYKPCLIDAGGSLSDTNIDSLRQIPGTENVVFKK